MKRRFRQQDDDTGLDSLLDTMTNVVGILVLVLIMTQLGVSEKVNSIAANSDVTQQELEDALADLDDQQQQLEELRRKAASVSTLDINTERQRLNRMQELLESRQQLVQQQTEQLNHYALQIETDQQRAKEITQDIQETEDNRKKLDAAITVAIRQRTELAARLDETPQLRAPKTTEIRIPHPRPAPAGAKEATFICSHGKLFPLRLEFHRKYAEDAGKSIITAQRLNLTPETGINANAFTELFTKLPPPDDEYFTAEYYVADNRWPRIRFVPTPENGESLKALTRSGSSIRKLINSLDPQQLFCRFHILPDSYEVYIAARRAVTNQKLLAGWEPHPESWQLTTSVPGIEVGPPRPKPPPPVTPLPPSKPPNVID